MTFVCPADIAVGEVPQAPLDELVGPGVLLGTDQAQPRCLLSLGEAKMDQLTKKKQPDRSKINMSESFEVKYWLKALAVSKDELLRAIDKVGNSAAAVRKELGV